MNLFLALLLSSFGAESLQASQDESEPNKLQEAVDRITRFIAYLNSHLLVCIYFRLQKKTVDDEFDVAFAKVDFSGKIWFNSGLAPGTEAMHDGVTLSEPKSLIQIAETNGDMTNASSPGNNNFAIVSHNQMSKEVNACRSVDWSKLQSLEMTMMMATMKMTLIMITRRRTRRKMSMTMIVAFMMMMLMMTARVIGLPTMAKIMTIVMTRPVDLFQTGRSHDELGIGKPAMSLGKVRNTKV